MDKRTEGGGFRGWLHRVGLLLIGRAEVVAIPNAKRFGRCRVCKNWSVLFVEPCPFCGTTGEVEYDEKVKSNVQRKCRAGHTYVTDADLADLPSRCWCGEQPLFELVS